MRIVMASVGLLFSMIVTSSCGREIPYMAKFCGGPDLALYVMEDLSTYSAAQGTEGISLDDPNLGKGRIQKKDKGEFIEYSGRLDFVALKDARSPNKIEGHPIEMRQEYYIVDSTTDYGSRLRFFIDLEGKLFRFDEHLTAKSGKEFSFIWENCGGEFIVS